MPCIMPRHIVDSTAKNLHTQREKKKHGKKKEFTSSKKLKKKRIECHYCHRNCFDVDNFLDIIRIWEGDNYAFVRLFGCGIYSGSKLPLLQCKA